MSFVCLWSPTWSIVAASADVASGEARSAETADEKIAERALHNPALQDDYGSQKGKAASAAWQDRRRRRGAPSTAEIDAAAAGARESPGDRGSGPGSRESGAGNRGARGARGAPPNSDDGTRAPSPRHRSTATAIERTPAAPDDAAATIDLTHDARFIALLPALLACTPRVSVGAGGRVWADARGLDGATTAQRLLDATHRHGFVDAHAGVASTVVAAELAATRCDATLIVVRPGTDRAFVAPFPVDVLAPSTLTASLLDGIGVATLGELAALDAASVEVRLGAEGAQLWRLARADDPRLVFSTAQRPLPSAAVEWVEYALRDPERLQFVINSLLGTVCGALASQGERAREITLDFALANRTRFAHTMRASRPTASQPGWMRIVRTTLDRLRIPDAVVGVELRVERVADNDAAQGDLFDRGFASAPAVESALAQIADDQSDVVATPTNSAHPLVDARTEWVAHAPSSVVEGDGEEARLRKTAGGTSAGDPQLTLQLVTPPRPVRVTTERRRDHRVPIRYRDGRWWTLVDVAGPDRVSGGQWDAPYAREYFRCVREDGVMVWLFRGEGRGTTGARGSGGGARTTGNRESEIGNRTAGSRESGIEDRGSAIGNRGSAIGNRGSAIGNRGSGIGNPESGIGGRERTSSGSGVAKQWFLQGWWD